MTSSAHTTPRTAGAAQGITIVASGFAPILAVVSLPPALPQIMAAFADTPNARVLAPLLVTLPGLMVAVLAPFAGLIVDRYGRRLPLLVGLAAFVALGVLPFVLDDLYLIAASRLGLGAAMTFILVISTALLADYFPEDKRRTWLTAQGIVLPLLAAASFAAVGLLGALDWHYTFLAYAAVIPVFVAALLFCFEPPRVAHDAAEQSPTAPFPWGPVLAVCLGSFVIGVFFFGFLIYSGLAFAAIRVTDPAMIGTILGAVSLITMAGAVVFNILSRRAPPKVIVAVQLVIMGVGFVGIALAPDLNTMIAFCLVHQIGGGMMVPTTIFWMSQVAPPEHRGRAFGLMNTASFLGQFAAPLAIALAETLRGGLRPGFLLFGLVGVALGVAAVLLGGARRSAVPA